MADTPALGAGGRKAVEVRVLYPAPVNRNVRQSGRFCPGSRLVKAATPLINVIIPRKTEVSRISAIERSIDAVPRVFGALLRP